MRDQQPSRRQCPCRGDPRSCRLAPQPRIGGAQQYHFVGAAAVQPGAQSGRADLALSAQSLARQLGIFQPGGHHGCLRDGLEPVCQQPRPGPLALRRRLGSSFARAIADTLLMTSDPRHPRVQKLPETRITYDCDPTRRSAILGRNLRRRLNYGLEPIWTLIWSGGEVAGAAANAVAAIPRVFNASARASDASANSEACSWSNTT